jgi:hypothetical protein
MALLNRLGALDPAASAALADLAAPIIHNHAGRVVGRIEPAPDWPPLGADTAARSGS